MSNWTSFVTRLDEVVRTHAHRPAVIVNGIVAASYRELWDLADRIAHGLCRRGIGPESVVAIRLDKSLEFVATLVGVWRARAAYLPLDPQVPLERQLSMVQDASASLVVVETCGSGVSSDLGISSIGWNDLVNHDPLPVELHSGPTQPDDLAWVIFTSGTTGRPRGVAVEQRGFVSLLDAQCRAFGLDSSSRTLAFYSFAFDAFLSDLGTTLLSGAGFCIELSAAVQESILNVIAERQITLVDLPPSLLASLDPRDAPDCLRTIVIGGEVCPPATVRRWASTRTVVNVYGPTEATVCSSLCVCDPDTWNRPLLGRPLTGVDYIVVNELGDSVMPGKTGELLIGGPCLAREYVNRPADTAIRFIWRNGRRYYRTGDKVRLDPDGEFVFAGRIDRQIKLRGLRIEPEEIEGVLNVVPGVRCSAVVVRKLFIQARRDQLVAFIESDGQLPLEVVQSALQRSLPAWMIPARIEVRERLPRTASNKIDLEALRLQPIASDQFRPTDSVESPVTTRLLTVLHSVLGMDCLGPDDDFFANGGDSMAVFEVIAAARRCGLEILPNVVATERTARRIGHRLNHLQSDCLSAEWLLKDIQPEIQIVTELMQAQQVRSTDPPLVAPPIVLLTGATGFLGTRVLQELLRRSRAHVVCLIRADDHLAASERLREAVTCQHVSIEESDWSRIRVVVGDVSSPSFGWPQEFWDEIAETVAGVMHCAARVNLFDDYATLRPDNLMGTLRVLQFAATGRIKRVWYASTLSVFVGTDRCTGVLREDDDLSQTSQVYGGYAQTKWAAEMLVRRSGFPREQVQVSRFGLLTGDSQTGIAPDHDLLTMTLRGLVRLGCVPDQVPKLQMDVTPVDFAAAAFVQLANLEERPNDVRRPVAWHIANPTSLTATELFQHLQSICPDLVPVNSHEFRRRVELQDDPTSAAACVGLSRWLLGTAPSTDLFQATGAQFEMSQTLQALASSGLRCPESTGSLIQRYIRQILQLPGTE